MSFAKIAAVAPRQILWHHSLQLGGPGGEMMRRIARVLSVVLCAAVPAGFAGAANAATPTLKSLSGKNIVNGFESDLTRDGSCPDSSTFGTPFEDYHQLFDADVVKKTHWESLGINICWLNSGAEGGDSVDTGSWELNIPHGTMRGTVTGGVGYAQHDDASFTLTITSGSGSLANLSGNLYFWSCGDEASALIASGLRATPIVHYPSACSEP